MLSAVKKSILMSILISLAVFLGSGNAFAISWTPDFSSSTHEVSTSSTNTSVTVSWDAMTPTGETTADSYVYVWDNTSNTEISASKTRNEDYSGVVSALTVTRTLADGTWYLHMRTVDTGANWTDTKHFGPIIIDTTPAPIVTKIEPDNGLNSTGTIEVDITGENFRSGATAMIGETALSPVTVNSSTSITATYAISGKTAGSYNVKVTTDWGTSEPLADGFTVKNPAPTVTAISPTSASNAADKSVTFTGTGFLAGASVQLRDPDSVNPNIDLTNESVSSKTSMTATVPAGKVVDTYNVVVTNTDSQSGTLSEGFQIKLPAPTIGTVSPSSGTNENSVTITITGTNLATTGGTPQVTLEATGKDTIACSSEAVTDATTMTAVVPAEQATGLYDVKVTNPDSQPATKSASFTVSYPVPTVATISPASMTNDDTQSVTITGTNFRSGAVVKIGTTSCSGVTLDGTTPSTKLTCTVPADIDSGTYDVKVNNTGTDPGTLTNGFTVSSGTTTVGLTYSASDLDHVPAGTLTITATFTQSQAAAPNISIDQQGSEAISEVDMTPSDDDKIWTYPYIVHAADGSSYIDGDATVTIKSSAGTTISITSGSTFTIDTASLSAAITYAQGDNTTSPFKAGTLTVTATLSGSQGSAPKISIAQQGTETIDSISMTSTGDDTIWTYDYTVVAKDGTTYKDGTATVTLKTSADASISIGSGGTFTIDTTPPTVALAYAQGDNTTSPFKAGALTITATFSETPAATPQIALTQPGDTDISATDMTATGSGRVWTYPYTIVAATGGTYIDGLATVAISNGGDSASNPNADATNNTFTIDTATTCTIDAVTTPTTSASQIITGTKETGATVAVAVTSPVTAGTVTYPTSTTWQCTISSLQEAANTITATATDDAGNTAQAETSITYDVTAPQVSSASYVDTTHVDVVFSEAIVGGTTTSKYSISGLTISAAGDQGSNTYRLITSEMTVGQTYTVVVSTTITDFAGNALDGDHKSAVYVTATLGDVDNNGQINVFDVIKIARASLGLENTGTFIEAVADITGDGNINVFDVIRASRLSLGLD